MTTKKVPLKLEGMDGNAFFILGAWKKSARKSGWSEEEIKSVVDDAKSGDFDHLLSVIMRHSE